VSVSGPSIEVLAETGSTNADVLARLRAGDAVSEGQWLVALRQTAGRGRLGRSWDDGAGNFMGSTPVRCGAGDPPAATLALVAGLALHETCAPLAPGVDLRLKWPNDLMAGGVDGAGKVAGILLERQGDCVVIGIGVNLSVAPPLADRKTAALAGFGEVPELERFARLLADAFAAELARWRLAGLPALLRRWQAAAHPAGTMLTVQGPGNEAVHGTFAGLADDGGLQLRLADGTTQVVHSGEVQLAAKGD